MEVNEIKKWLYKNKPIAYFMYIRKGNAYYKADLESDEVIFEVPVSDMGDADFLPAMPAQSLNRWIRL